MKRELSSRALPSTTTDLLARHCCQTLHELSTSQHPRLGSKIHQQVKCGKMHSASLCCRHHCQHQLSESRHASDLLLQTDDIVCFDLKRCLKGSGLSLCVCLCLDVHSCLSLTCLFHCLFLSTCQRARSTHQHARQGESARREVRQWTRYVSGFMHRPATVSIAKIIN